MEHKTKWATSVFILTVSLFFSCVSINKIDGAPIDEQKVQQIKPGITTYGDILKWFGPPTEILLTPPNEYGFYYYSKQEKIRLLHLVIWKYHHDYTIWDKLIVYFDNQRKVKFYAFRKGDV